MYPNFNFLSCRQTDTPDVVFLALIVA